MMHLLLSKITVKMAEKKTFIFSKSFDVISSCCKNFETPNEGHDPSFMIHQPVLS